MRITRLQLTADAQSSFAHSIAALQHAFSLLKPRQAIAPDGIEPLIPGEFPDHLGLLATMADSAAEDDNRSQKRSHAEYAEQDGSGKGNSSPRIQ